MGATGHRAACARGRLPPGPGDPSDSGEADAIMPVKIVTDGGSSLLKQEGTTPVGIKDIAKALGISIGTVDRALHGRAGISPKTRAKILNTAEKFNYRPNVAARNLKLNRRLHIAVHLPLQISSFFDPLREGIRTAAEAMVGVPMDLDFRTYPHMGRGDIESLETDVRRHYDGIILTPSNPSKFDALIHSLMAEGTQVVCVASDAPRSGRLASVSVHAEVSGAIAAELFARTIARPGQVSFITGDLSTQDHTEKLRGFAAALATIAPHLSLLPAVETHDRPRDAWRETMTLLNRKQRPSGIYVSTANSLPVLKALEEQRALDQVLVITTDLFPEITPFLESGKILATLYQRPAAQGKVALESLIRFLLDGTAPHAVTRLAPHIVFRSNLSLFDEKVRRVEE